MSAVFWDRIAKVEALLGETRAALIETRSELLAALVRLADVESELQRRKGGRQKAEAA